LKESDSPRQIKPKTKTQN
jgi:hypothetical protein